MAPRSGRLVVNGSATGIYPQFHLYTGTSFSDLNEVLTLAGSSSDSVQNLLFDVLEGIVYQIEVDRMWNPDWSVAFSLNLSPRPDNDNFSDRPLLQGTNLTISGDNTLATIEPGEPNHAGRATGRSVWYSWTAPVRGALTVASTASGSPPVLAVYLGTSISNLTPVASTAATSLTFR